MYRFKTTLNEAKKTSFKKVLDVVEKHYMPYYDVHSIGGKFRKQDNGDSHHTHIYFPEKQRLVIGTTKNKDFFVQLEHAHVHNRIYREETEDASKIPEIIKNIHDKQGRTLIPKNSYINENAKADADYRNSFREHQYKVEQMVKDLKNSGEYSYQKNKEVGGEFSGHENMHTTTKWKTRIHLNNGDWEIVSTPIGGINHIKEAYHTRNNKIKKRFWNVLELSEEDWSDSRDINHKNEKEIIHKFLIKKGYEPASHDYPWASSWYHPSGASVGLRSNTDHGTHQLEIHDGRHDDNNEIHYRYEAKYKNFDPIKILKRHIKNDGVLSEATKNKIHFVSPWKDELEDLDYTKTIAVTHKIENDGRKNIKKRSGSQVRKQVRARKAKEDSESVSRILRSLFPNTRG